MKTLLKILAFITILPFVFAATPATTTVKEVLKNAKKYDTVVLEGKLIKQIDDDAFIFEDATGRIKVEFDDDIFGKTLPNLNTQIKILALADTHRFKDTDLEVTKFKYLEAQTADDF